MAPTACACVRSPSSCAHGRPVQVKVKVTGGGGGGAGWALQCAPAPPRASRRAATPPLQHPPWHPCMKSWWCGPVPRHGGGALGGCDGRPAFSGGPAGACKHETPTWVVFSNTSCWDDPGPKAWSNVKLRSLLRFIRNTSSAVLAGSSIVTVCTRGERARAQGGLGVECSCRHDRRGGRPLPLPCHRTSGPGLSAHPCFLLQTMAGCAQPP
jgi:hypothetical protein